MKALVISTLLAAFAVPKSPAGPAFECDMQNINGQDRMAVTFVVSRMPDGQSWGEGTVIGRSGAASLSISKAISALNFFEFTASGNVMLATIVLPEGGVPVSRFDPVTVPVVYSRHTVMGPATADDDGLVPSQYRGLCRVKN